MFLHVGGDVEISMKRVIAILDLRSSKAGEATREFLAMAYGQKRLIDIADGKMKSLVLTEKEIYLSPISSLTLMKRADFLANNIVHELGV
jgi:hypothetical protein